MTLKSVCSDYAEPLEFVCVCRKFIMSIFKKRYKVSDLKTIDIFFVQIVIVS